MRRANKEYDKVTGGTIDKSRVTNYLKTVKGMKSTVGGVFDERGEIYTEVYLDTDQGPHQPQGYSVVEGGGGRVAYKSKDSRFSGQEVRTGAQRLIEGSAEWHLAVTIPQMLDWARYVQVADKHVVPTKQSVPLDGICYEGFVYREDEQGTEKRYVLFHCYPKG
jgi:hypothetical protein